mmetsp:Transcript_36571/g.70219  ORF Transcript_36571/g.70219 Transcript_36571/m.70219 type:complete len:200 (-) Transcript_36571:312-911(-)|eukprot:CAMPEP_0114247170 /NCGR_PEP_ID=MMETSP0058-20121206/12877_1 /TAXON_ID=36894 /ORGANISM="Pyramimonas parkeae, CCMP726" /LENGTH=199 /DNA_ID=CAMNT_0001360453 /DNA_START=221 /DNA_END=820 /DNA_ORIENTATION=+
MAPATAGRVPMPAGNRVTTSSALKVSDRWTALVGDDPYKKEAEGDDNMMEKLWADPRLHGGAKRRIGTDDSGKAIFAATGEEKRNIRKQDALAAREAEFERLQERKRAAAQTLIKGPEDPLSKRSKKEKKDKKDKKDKKEKDKKRKKDKKEKDKKDKKKKHKKEKSEKKHKSESKKRKRDDSSSDSGSGSDSGSDSESD